MRPDSFDMSPTQRAGSNHPSGAAGSVYNLHEALKRATDQKGHLQRGIWAQKIQRHVNSRQLALPAPSEVARHHDAPGLRSEEFEDVFGSQNWANGGGVAGFPAEVVHSTHGQELAFLMSRVCPAACRKLVSESSFQKLFLEKTECKAFVMAIDIRRSTELMLRARSAAEFSRFLTDVCGDIEVATKMSFGIFDKFTGDGTLAYFPDFYSGVDAGYHVMEAAHKCHEIFRTRYREHRSSFTPVLGDVGLGIGIDYGMVQIARLSYGQTIVGGPVVYAFRLSGGPAHRTYVNQAACELIMNRYPSSCLAAEATLEVKNEGRILCHDLQMREGSYVPELPGWMKAA